MMRVYVIVYENNFVAACVSSMRWYTFNSLKMHICDMIMLCFVEMFNGFALFYFYLSSIIIKLNIPSRSPSTGSRDQRRGRSGGSVRALRPSHHHLSQVRYLPSIPTLQYNIYTITYTIFKLFTHAILQTAHPQQQLLQQTLASC